MNDTKIIEKFYHRKRHISVSLFFTIFNVEQTLRSDLNLFTHEEFVMFLDGHHDDDLHDEPG